MSQRKPCIATALILMAAVVSTACGDDGDGGKNATEADNSTRFRVRLENISSSSALPTPFSPGIWALTTSSQALFEAMAADRGEGLEALAEDGDPGMLGVAVDNHASVATSGVFSIPQSATSAAPIMPGQAYEIELEAERGDGELSLASMLVHSNDLFVAPDGAIPLFAADGMPLPERNVTSMLKLWDAGTERNQAPGAGPDQAPRQVGPNTGPAEGVLSVFRGSTRAYPGADRIIDVSVTASGDELEITVANVSDTRGAILTPLAPVFWAVHDGNWYLFNDGGTASAGLEELAEDGSPAGLVAEHYGQEGVLAAGAQATTVERPSDPAGPAAPGERFRFTLTPNAKHPYLSLAAMVVESNDAFIALPPAGVALLDDMGELREAGMVEADLQRLLAVWDAGTEANEAAGLGPNQPMRSAPNTGAADMDTSVRRHFDSTNDFANPQDLFDVAISAGTLSGSFDVTITNVSGETAYPTPLTPVVWTLHDDSFALFAMGEVASTELERLAEDGNPMPLSTWVSDATGVGDSGVANVPMGAGSPGPLMPGASYSFTVMPDATHRYFSFAAMVVQTNDALLSLMPASIALYDSTGSPRSLGDISTDLDAALAIIDAGTEANQVGGAGPHQALRQDPVNTGPAEGSGLVRSYDDPIWTYPEVADLVRLTVTPLGE